MEALPTHYKMPMEVFGLAEIEMIEEVESQAVFGMRTMLTSWSDFAKEIFKLANLNCNVSPISTDQYPTPAIRPQNTTLSKEKIKNHFSLKIPLWQKSLKECLKEIT